MPDSKTKKVGNTIKSRKMSGYLDDFINTGVDLLLRGKGHDFIESYYSYIDDIYNYRIPIKDIASKGNIKKTIEEYKNDCKQVTKSGSKKARQAWYELVIQNNVSVNVSDTIYYINTGTKKNHSDVKRVTHQFTKYFGEEEELTSKLRTSIIKDICEKDNIVYKELKQKDKNEMIKPYITREEDEIVLNCKMVPNEIINSDEKVLCSDVEDMEYNVEKYIEQFNKRIKPLLVCFSPDIRNQILVEKPSERKYFTEEESQLVSGYPNKETDQDTYEALMTPEKKEIEFWLSMNETPPFIKECDIDWDKLVDEYKENKKKEETELFQHENEQYLKALDELTDEDIDEFENEGTIPKSLTDIVYMDSDMHFYFKNISEKTTPSTGGYIFDDIKKVEYDVSY